MENSPLDPLELPLPSETADPMPPPTSVETSRPPLVSPEQLQQLGKEAYHALVSKDPTQNQDQEPAKSRFESLSEHYFEKRHESLDNTHQQSYHGKLTPVGEIISQLPASGPRSASVGSDKPELDTDVTQHQHSLATDYKKILTLAIITGVLLAATIIFWVNR